MESWNVPAMHAQSVCSLLPASEVAPAGHVEHGPDPMVFLYVSASHAVHATPSEAAVYPPTHLQSVKSLLPDAELVRSGHVKQCVASAGSAEFMYIPAAHEMQLVRSADDFVPLSHWVQAPPLIDVYPTPQSVHASETEVVDVFPAAQSVHSV